MMFTIGLSEGGNFISPSRITVCTNPLQELTLLKAFSAWSREQKTLL